MFWFARAIAVGFLIAILSGCGVESEKVTLNPKDTGDVIRRLTELGFIPHKETTTYGVTIVELRKHVGETELQASLNGTFVMIAVLTPPDVKHSYERIQEAIGRGEQTINDLIGDEHVTVRVYASDDCTEPTEGVPRAECVGHFHGLEITIVRYLSTTKGAPKDLMAIFTITAID